MVGPVRLFTACQKKIDLKNRMEVTQPATATGWSGWMDDGSMDY